MNEIANPYAAPASAPPMQAEAEPVDPAAIAGHGARIANMIIDSVAQWVLGLLFGILVVIVGGDAAIAWLEGIPDLAIGVPVLLLYYVVLETTTSRTLGKLITGTKVVQANGMPPSFGQVIERTLCRLIPLDMFSFLRKPVRGWHDRFSKTFVIKVR